MVETQLCKLRGTSDTFVGRAYSIFRIWFLWTNLFKEKWVSSCQESAKYSPWAPRNWNRDLVTHRPVYPVWTWISRRRSRGGDYGVCGEFGWVRLLVVCFLLIYKTNPKPRKIICCGKKWPKCCFWRNFSWVRLASVWGVRRFHNTSFIKSWKTSAVTTTVWMVETQLCKLRGTSDAFA